VIFYKANPETF